MRGIISIVIGTIFIVAGLTGRMVLIGTQSGGALAAVGVAIVLLGVFRMTRGR
jgi:hypothetical protein